MPILVPAQRVMWEHRAADGQSRLTVGDSARWHPTARQAKAPAAHFSFHMISEVPQVSQSRK